MKAFVQVYQDRIRPLLVEGHVDGAVLFIQQELARESVLRDGMSPADGEYYLATSSGMPEEYGHYLICLKLLCGKGFYKKEIGSGLRDSDVRNDIIKRVDVHVTELAELLETDKLPV